MTQVKVGYLGSSNSTFGYLAMIKYFSEHGIEVEPCGFVSHTEVCEAVGKGLVDYGVVAIENVLDGVVPESARSVERADTHRGVKICGEVVLSIKLFFASKTGQLTDAKKIISHSSALGQCGACVRRLERELDIFSETRPSTGKAAEDAAEDSSLLALVPSETAEKFGLVLVDGKCVTDHPNSMTRFWILGKRHAERTGIDKTCFLVNLEQAQAGALHRTFGVFAEENVNVLIIYPISIFGRQWEYTFLVEVEGHIDDEPIDSAWDKFRQLGIFLRPMQFLGSYPNRTK